MKTKWMMQAVLVVCCMALAAGCATSGGGAKTTKAAPGADEKTAITNVLNEWSAALASKNVDKILAFYSDSFKDDEGRDKAGIRELIEGAISQGYLDGAKVELASTQVTVNGAQAVASPVTLSGNMGSISLSVSFKKEAKGWLISGSSQA